MTRLGVETWSSNGPQVSATAPRPKCKLDVCSPHPIKLIHRNVRASCCKPDSMSILRAEIGRVQRFCLQEPDGRAAILMVVGNQGGFA